MFCENEHKEHNVFVFKFFKILKEKHYHKDKLIGKLDELKSIIDKLKNKAHIMREILICLFDFKIKI